MEYKKRKVAILTQPLISNYGGILQNYALQKVLKDLGHDVLTIDRKSPKTSYAKKMLSFAVRLAKKVLFRRSIVVRTWPTPSEENLILKHCRDFIQRKLNLTDEVIKDEDFLRLKKYNFDTYIVGSDQVWRPKYSPSIGNYFFDFLPSDDPSLRLAYAASFGVDNNEFEDNELNICKTLLKRFHGITVREDSAIRLLKENFGVSAEHVLDPTMLLNKDDYEALTLEFDAKPSSGNLMTYILDPNPDKSKIVNQVSSALELKEFSVLPENKFSKSGSAKILNCIYPPLTSWLRGFMDAEFVITDSFHGTAFSIIFNKPFIAIGNKERGLSRFTSLLKIVGLENRLIFTFNDFSNDLLYEKINFDLVNSKRGEERRRSIAILKRMIGND